MSWVQNGGLLYFQFSNLLNIPGLNHGVMSRLARTSETGQTFNLGLKGSDPPDVVWANRDRILSVFEFGRGVYAQQVHGCQVAIWPDDELEKKSSERNRRPYGRIHGDAIITSSPQNALVIQVADCQSVLMADPIKRVVANVHSGWRGSIRNIVAKTVDKMMAQWGCHAKDIVCGIGPSLGPCCAEFINYKKELPKQYWIYQRTENHFDFWQITLDQLTEKGIPEKNVEFSHLCSKCNQHLFFSYRGNKQSGRFATVIGWK